MVAQRPSCGCDQSVNKTFAFLSTFVGTVKNGQVFLFQKRSIFNGHGSANKIVGSFYFFFGEAKCIEQAPLEVEILLGFESQSLQALFTERVNIEYESDLKG